MPDLSDEEIKKEVQTLHTAVYEKFNYEMKYLRPPKGEFSQRTLSLTKSLGYTTVMWSFAYDDWDESKQGREAYAKEKILSNVHNGAVILLHANSKDNCNILDEIIKSTIKDDMSDEDKVLAIHDYIINHTKYDVLREKGTSKYKSNTAYGALIEGYAVCGGYADAMSLFLNRFNIKNFKISTDTHVWNAIYINGNWLHLDLTWDDPVLENSTEDTLLHKFYLIDTKKLEDYKITDHEYDKTIYSELS